jgi:hypothetical protein
MARHERGRALSPIRARPTLITLALLAGVLIRARTSRGTTSVLWLRGFLEFYSGVFALLAMTATVVAGVVAAQRGPARFRILAQAAHRATAFMTVGFLVAHVLLKIMESHANVLDTVVPFGSGLFYVGLGTIASDVLILVMATGLLRGRFAGGRPWIWRAVHALAYAMWPLSIVHGLVAGRTPKAWVTISYVVCMALVLVAVLARLPRIFRDRRMVPSGTSAKPPPAADDVPDAEFWRSLRAEAAQWIGERR